MIISLRNLVFYDITLFEILWKVTYPVNATIIFEEFHCKLATQNVIAIWDSLDMYHDNHMI